MNQRSGLIATTEVKVVTQSSGLWLFQATVLNQLSLDCSCMPALQHPTIVFSSSTNTMIICKVLMVQTCKSHRSPKDLCSSSLLDSLLPNITWSLWRRKKSRKNSSTLPRHKHGNFQTTTFCLFSTKKKLEGHFMLIPTCYLHLCIRSCFRPDVTTAKRRSKKKME